MCKLRFFLPLSIICVILGACKSETTTTKHKVSKDPWGNELPFSIGKDADGNPMMQSDKRSSFDSKQSNIASRKDFSGSDYSKKSYRKERWGGNTLFKRKKYAGNTDANRYKKEPWYVRKQASASGRQAKANNKKFSVNPFRSKSSRSSDSRRFSASQNSGIEKRRQNYKQPNITNWKDQGGLSVKDTNSMLGR